MLAGVSILVLDGACLLVIGALLLQARASESAKQHRADRAERIAIRHYVRQQRLKASAR